MILVAVDTSTQWAGVGVETESGERTETVWRSDQNHGRELINNITLALAEFDLKPAEITHLAVALGPGGFSAVRVGISAVLGLAMASDLPISGIPTHLLEAFPYLGSSSPTTPLLSLIPAGRGELSWARFESDSEEPVATGLSAPAELVDTLSPGARICGEGARQLSGQIGDDRILSGDGSTRSPASLLTLAKQRFQAGETQLRPLN